ncbi:MAG: sulfur carrier protein ThiS, partial [Alphaproteobacteria bacterium]
MSVVINGENREITSPITVTILLRDLGLDARKIALEHNLEIVPRSAYDKTLVSDGDRLEIVHFIGGGDALSDQDGDSDDDSWTVAGRKMTSRLIIGTGKYESYDQNRRAAEAAGAQMVTVAVRRVNVTDPGQEMLVDHVD